MVRGLKTRLCDPEEVVIRQYQKGEAIYLISKGECTVTVDQDDD